MEYPLKILSKSCVQLEEITDHTDGEYNRTLAGFLTLSPIAVISGQRGNMGLHTNWTAGQTGPGGW